MALTKEGLYEEIYDNVLSEFIDSAGLSDEGKAELESQVGNLAKAIIDHVVDNVQNNLLERFENLESDFDSFVQTMLGVGVGPATAVPAAVTAFIATSNTVTRATQKTAQSSIQKPYIHGSK